MSAICGLYAKNIDNKETNAMMMELGKYKSDQSNFWQSEVVFLGSHLNFTTPESSREVLPFYDQSNSLVITADAIVDNRAELFELLEIPLIQQNISDSELILLTYKKWGINCSEKIIGDFSFAIWNILKQELFCSRDQVGKRPFYYYRSDDLFAFSTLIKPLFKINQIKKELNDDFIADFLAENNILQNWNPNVTIYKNILQLPAGCSLLVNGLALKIWQYWSTNQNNPIIYKTDAEYESAFRTIFSEAVKCRLRSTGKIGIMLSGGLDSGAIAVMAAPELQKQHQLLYSYTQIPMKNYQNLVSPRQIVNETPFVEELCRHHTNIKATYIDAPGKNPLTEIDYLIDVLEEPYKMFQNTYWTNEINLYAKNLDIKILLDGQSGNSTVSWGYFNPYLSDLIKQRRFKTIYKETKAYAKLKQLDHKKVLKSIIYQQAPSCFKKVINKIRRLDTKSEIDTLINPIFYKKIIRNIKSKKNQKKTSENSYECRSRLLDNNALSYMGSNEAKKAMAFGITKRDPTRDKRVIEFCMNIPSNQFVRDGVERRLIRVAMQGLLPDMIRQNTKFGRQAADWLQRIAPDWEKTWQEIDSIGKHDLEKKYFDLPKIKEKLAKNKVIDISIDGNWDLILLIRALIFSKFIRKNFPQTTTKGD